VERIFHGASRKDAKYAKYQKITNLKQMKSKIRSTNFETRNKKGKLKILNSKDLKTREKFSLEGFGF